MSEVVDFEAALRARINQMADEHLAMQEALANIPVKDVPAYLDKLDRHSAELSRLASRMLGAEVRIVDEQSAERQARSDPNAVRHAPCTMPPEDPEAA